MLSTNNSNQIVPQNSNLAYQGQGQEAAIILAHYDGQIKAADAQSDRFKDNIIFYILALGPLIPAYSVSKSGEAVVNMVFSFTATIFGGIVNSCGWLLNYILSFLFDSVNINSFDTASVKQNLEVFGKTSGILAGTMVYIYLLIAMMIWYHLLWASKKVVNKVKSVTFTPVGANFNFGGNKKTKNKKTKNKKTKNKKTKNKKQKI